MSKNSVNNRRDFIKNVFVAAPAIALFGSQTPYAVASQATSAQLSTPDNYTPLYFKKEEWLFISAAVDCLIPHDDNGPGALEIDVPIFIDRQMFGYFGHAASWYMEGPFDPSAAPDRGYQLPLTPQQLYRLGIEETNHYCLNTYKKIFAELSTEQKCAVLAGLEKHDITSSRLPLDIFFSFLLDNTKEGYFADPIHGGNKDMQSWKMIGYPGARASYLEWVDKYNVHYPVGPVSLKGAEL